MPATSGIFVENYPNTIYNEPIILPQWGNSAWLGNSNNIFWRGYFNEVHAYAFIPLSDARFKTNIQPLSYGLATILTLQPVKYDLQLPLDENLPQAKQQAVTESGKDQLGLLAQDVLQIVPEVVVYDSTADRYGLNYTALIPVLINAIKEQQVQLDSLQQQIILLQNQ